MEEVRRREEGKRMEEEQKKTEEAKRRVQVDQFREAKKLKQEMQ